MNDKEKVKQRNCTGELLEGLYKNVNMETESLTQMVSKVKSKDLSAELTSQLNTYGEFSSKIESELKASTGMKPEKSMISSVTSKLGIEMNTLMDSSDDRIAQMVIESTTMGITDTIRLVRDYENSNCRESALSLAKDVVTFQEGAVERTKSFL